MIDPHTLVIYSVQANEREHAKITIKVMHELQETKVEEEDEQAPTHTVPPESDGAGSDASGGDDFNFSDGDCDGDYHI